MSGGWAQTRLLPWSGPEGKPCYLVGDGTGYVSRMADTTESVQLGMAGELLDHATDMLGDHEVTSVQLQFLVARMAEALRDVHRIAESRGARLPACAACAACAYEGFDGDGDGDGGSDGDVPTVTGVS
ncbi:hypothetical protein QF026_005559 [Streptomyces aurantiacus]|uniref:hypothetical protein n=1 Tax=Streptomyces aurantiacus TaxID=47760 RepID=UPI00278D4CD4|nr:hypothetical protein [Streptomyces aurantiacus]MDQ0777093.1 hypothetical protein [Streptomyces aurantiacus]